MASRAIVHVATRLIYGLTADDPPPQIPGAEAVVVANGMDLAGGPYVLNEDGSMSRATEQQVRDAFEAEGPGIVEYMIAVWANGD